MGQDVKIGRPIYNVFDETMKFDGAISTGFFHVKTSNFFPFRFRGNEFNDAGLVYNGVESDIFTHGDILLQYKSSHLLEPKHFESLFFLFLKDFKNLRRH
jgi:hypothetical protein